LVSNEYNIISKPFSQDLQEIFILSEIKIISFDVENITTEQQQIKDDQK
jgi:hypothetical protein